MLIFLSSLVVLQEMEVNLIITDYCMPGMTGYDLLRKIKVRSLILILAFKFLWSCSFLMDNIQISVKTSYFPLIGTWESYQFWSQTEV